MPEERQSFNVGVLPSAKEKFSAWCQENGRDQYHVAGRLVEWFVWARPPVQRVMAQEIEGMELRYAEALEGMAADIRRRLAGGEARGVVDDGDDDDDVPNGASTTNRRPRAR